MWKEQTRHDSHDDWVEAGHVLANVPEKQQEKHTEKRTWHRVIRCRMKQQSEESIEYLKNHCKMVVVNLELAKERNRRASVRAAHFHFEVDVWI